MIRHHVAQQIQPEDGELGQHSSFVGNGRWQDIIERGKTIRGDKDQELAGVVDVTHLAAGKGLNTVQVSLKQGFQYLVLSRNGNRSQDP